MKVCSRCKIEKPPEEFRKDKNRWDGLYPYCLECNRIYEQQRYNNNLEKSRSRCKDRTRKYRDAHPEVAGKDRENAKNWYQNNRDRANSNRKLWRNTTISGILSLAKMNSKRRENVNAVINSLTADDVEFLFYLQNNECAKCGTSFDVKKASLDHIVPVSKGGGLTLENTQLLCRSCNSSKNDTIAMYRPKIHFKCLSFI